MEFDQRVWLFFTQKIVGPTLCEVGQVGLDTPE